MSAPLKGEALIDRLTEERRTAKYLRTTVARFLMGNVQAKDVDEAAEDWLRMRGKAAI